MGYLNQYTRRRVAAVLLVLGIVVVALAIADLGPFSDPPTPEELAEDATREFFTAGAAEDYEKACSLMTKMTRETIERQFALLGAEENVEGCPAILEVAAKKALADGELEVLEISVSGPQARVEIKRRIEGEGRLQRTVLLQEVEGRWKIADPGFD
jgi:Domain of unknown function (DUF4878)